MTQLTLDLLVPAAPSLVNFVTGQNGDCIALVRRIATGERAPRFVHLWGALGSGRSHLLRGLCAESPAARLIAPDAPIAAFAFDSDIDLYAVDDVHTLGPAQQEALFHLFNRIQANPRAALVVAADTPPLGLTLREVLRTRLGLSLVFELHPLSDEDKAHALRMDAARRGVNVAADVIPWMLLHQSRDMRALQALFDALDRHAYRTRRAITLPLLREMLRARGNPSTGAEFGHTADD